MARQMVRHRGSRAPQRKSLWLDFAQVFTAPTTVAAATAVLLASLNAAGLALRPFTIVRTRGLLLWASDQGTATETPFGAFGFAVVSDQASAIGVTAVPTPIVDAGSSLWYSWTPMAVRLRFASGVGIQQTGYVTEFDSKAMRKVEIGQDVVAVVENGSAAQGGSFLALARILIKTN